MVQLTGEKDDNIGKGYALNGGNIEKYWVPLDADGGYNSIEKSTKVIRGG